MKGNLIKITCLSILTISFTFMSYKNETKEIASNNELKTKVEKKGINDFVDDYINTLQTDSLKFVDDLTCGKVEQNIEQYGNNIHLYHVDEIEKLKGNLNTDNEEDFVVSYFASNCWNGIGAGNYLTNLFFVLSKNGIFEVDEKETLNFKQKFIDAITTEYKDNGYKTAVKHEIMNNIKFTKIKDGKGNGEFAIIQCGAGPCVEGNFEYDFNTSELTLKNIKKNQY